MYYVYVKGHGHTWLFEDFPGGTQRDAESCAAIMNSGDTATDNGWKYYSQEVNA